MYDRYELIGQINFANSKQTFFRFSKRVSFPLMNSVNAALRVFVICFLFCSKFTFTVEFNIV